MTQYAKDIEEIKKHINDLHERVAKIEVNIGWHTWLLCLIAGALIFAPLIARFWQGLGI